jgi:hypothetical protein
MAEISSGVWQDISSDASNLKATYEILKISSRVDLNHGLSTLVDQLEWEMPDIFLHIWIVKCPSNQTFGIENRVVRVLRRLVLRSVSDKSFVVRESNP